MSTMRKATAVALSAAALFGLATLGAPSAEASTTISTTQNTTQRQCFKITNWYTICITSPTRVQFQVQPVQQAPVQQQPVQQAPVQTQPAQPAPAPVQKSPVVQQPVQQAPATNGLTAEEQQMLNLVNQERAKNGLKPLQADLELTKVARVKSQDMITNNYFSHNSPTYGSPFDMMKRFGISYRTAGENLAGNSTVSAAHTALMNSSGHRANILSPNYTHVGIGIVKGGKYGSMYTQMFVGR